jgi:putative hydrolase of the HAD superfamily
MRAPLPRCRAVFLDAGGTLIHLDRELILSRMTDAGVNGAARRFDDAHRAACARVAALIASDEGADDSARWNAFATGLIDGLGCPRDVASGIRDALDAHNAAGGMWSRVAPGTDAALRSLRSLGVTVGVVSNSDGRAAEALERAGLAHHFDFVIDSAVVGYSKPDPRIFDVACERAGVRPDEAMHVGDIEEIDVAGARRAGVRAVLFDPEGHAPDGVDRVGRLDEIAALVIASDRATRGRAS